MKILLHFAFVGVMLLLSQRGLFAQNPAENLQSAVEIYNAMREYEDGLDSKTLTQSNIDDVKSRMDKCIVLLDQVIREGNADQIKTARYFRNNAKYEYGFILGMKGQNALAFEVMKEVEKDVTSFTSADFPLKYLYFGTNYVINWDNFAPTQAEFLTGMAEICYNLSKYEDAVRVNRKAIAHPNTTGWLRYIAVNKMLDIYAKNKNLLTPDEYNGYAHQAIFEYDKLSEAEKETVTENDYPTVTRSMDILLKEAQANPTQVALDRIAQAIPIVIKYDKDNSKILTAFELCYKNNYQGQGTWDRTAHDYAKVAHTKSQTAQPQDFGTATRARYIGIAATDRIASTTSADCQSMKDVAAMYAYWKQTEKEAEYLKKAKACTEASEKAAAKSAKIARRSNGNFNLYIGADIIPLLNTNPKRDYGAVVDFVFKKSAIEFGYKKINRNKENVFDLLLDEVDDASSDNISRWDGFKLHFQPKFFTKNGNSGYFGIYLGYNEKNFDSLAVNVVNDLDGAYSNQVFKPGVKQYVGMFNFGGMILGKGVGMDMHFGIGANYSSFETGNSLDRTQYTIENPILEYRKDNYWGLVLHMGITMGLNFGPGRS